MQRSSPRHKPSSVLKQLHDDLDKAVFDAYGWPDLAVHCSSRSVSDTGRRGPKATQEEIDAEILERLVALNAARAAEEAQGKIRWLRPDFQNPEGTTAKQTELAVDTEQSAGLRPPTSDPRPLAPWPKSLPDQVRVLREALATQPGPATAETIARQFTRARKDRVEELLQTLVAMGQAREVEDGRFVGG